MRVDNKEFPKELVIQELNNLSEIFPKQSEICLDYVDCFDCLISSACLTDYVEESEEENENIEKDLQKEFIKFWDQLELNLNK